MRIITVTTYNVYNYGAALQAYALQKYLISLGHEAWLLNYQPDYLRRRYDYRWVNPESSFNKYSFTRYLYRVAKYLQRQFTLKRKTAFDSFIAEELKQTALYTCHSEIYTNFPKADAYIVGSDQVWNCFYEAGRDSVFYLDFVKDAKKASYAASFSYMNIGENFKQKIRKWLSDFDAISVREYQGVNILDELGLKSEWVLDPVFLLSKEEWYGKIKSVPSTERYLLIYDFEGNSNLKYFAKRYAKENGLMIYSINDTYPRLYADKNFCDEGPWGFLSLLMNCSAFISNSFHGTAFSILFHKDFYVFGRQRHAVNSRMESLLKMFNLEERFVYNNNYFANHNKVEINWCEVDKIKESFLRSSKLFLENI